jgi:hypothetical protein
MFEKCFKVDDIAYVVKFDNSEFSLYVDCLKTKKKPYEDISDDLFSFVDDDGPVERVFYMNSMIKTKNPMKVYANVMSFVKNVIDKKRPYYFTYTANEKKKMNVYAKVAEKIAKKYGYIVSIDGEKIRFLKNTN